MRRGKNPLRIAFVINNYLPRVGGLETHVSALAAELAKAGHAVLVINVGDNPGTRNDQGVEVTTLGEWLQIGGLLGFPALGAKRRVRKLLESHKVDVVSIHTRFFPMSYVGLRAARSLQLPVLHTEHGSDYVSSDSWAIRIGSRCVDNTLGRMVLRGSNQVLGVSEEVARFVKKLAGVDADVFYNAIEPPKNSGEAVPDRPNRFVFVGRIVQGKGWDAYLDLIARLRDGGAEIQGEILGDGPEMPKLREQWRRLKLHSVVEVRGQVGPAEVRRALSGATLVNPTVLSEGFQTTILEAIAERGRVLTYPVPGAARLLQDGAPVYITEERTLEALVTAAEHFIDAPPVLADPALLQNWTWPIRAQQYVEFCEKIVSDAGDEPGSGT